MKKSPKGWMLALIFLGGGGIFFLLHLMGYGEDYDMGAYGMFFFSVLIFVLSSITKRSKSDIANLEQEQRQEQQESLDNLKKYLEDQDTKEKKKKFGF